ncbi:MAG: EcsC family protein [Paracoccaceae bacterium]
MTTAPSALPVPLSAADPEAQIAALVLRHARANGPVMALVTRLGGRFERQLALIPPSLKARIGQVTEKALATAWGVAGARALPKGGKHLSMAAAVVSGAAGGVGGLATSVAELPVSVTVILHAIRQQAIAAGYDPDTPRIRAECLQVFAAGSPLAADDGIDTAFVSARLTLTGPALQKLISVVAPKLAAVMTQKLAAQAVPVLGAITGAALNAAFLRYYSEIAAIRFALLRLADQHGDVRILQAFRDATQPAPLNRA